MNITYDSGYADIGSIEKSIQHEYQIGRTPNSAAAEKEAEQKGLDVVYPTSKQLQIDIDTEYRYQVFQSLRGLLHEHYGIDDVEEHASRSGLPKRHITVTLFTDVTEMERIALQACLGSDRVRELLGLVQAKQGDEHPTLDLSKGKKFTPDNDDVVENGIDVLRGA